MNNLDIATIPDNILSNLKSTMFHEFGLHGIHAAHNSRMLQT